MSSSNSGKEMHKNIHKTHFRKKASKNQNDLILVLFISNICIRRSQNEISSAV
jgi:hypothetical protein